MKPSLDKVITFFLIWGPSFMGCIIRVLLEDLLKKSGTTLSLSVGGLVGTDFLANIAGCILMGICLPNFCEKLPILSTAFMSGLCGTLSTFSGWQVQTTILFLWNWKIVDGFLSILVGYSAFFMAFKLGQHIALAFKYLISKLSRIRFNRSNPDSNHPMEQVANEDKKNENSNSHHDTSVNEENGQKTYEKLLLFSNIWVKTIISLIIVLFICAWISFLVLTFSIKYWRKMFFSLFLTPFGSGLRWILSLYNKKFLKFKLFTFIVNVLGCIIYGLCILFKTYNLVQFQIDMLNAVSTGFCGAFTTTSTFVSELSKMEIPWSYFYFLCSIGITQGSLFIILANYNAQDLLVALSK